MAIGAILVVLGVGGFAGLRYGLYRLESREMRTEAVELLEAGEVEEAERLLQAYHMRRPEDLDAALLLAEAKLRRQPLTQQLGLEALALSDEFLVGDPESRRAKLLRLQALMVIGQGETAFAYSRELQSAMPSQPLPTAVLTRGLIRRGQYAEAARIAEQALSTPLPQPGLVDQAHDVLIEAYVALGQREEAAKWAKESLDADPLSPNRLERWARTGPVRADPNPWVQHADNAATPESTDGDVLRLVALQLAQRRALELNRPEEARNYRLRFVTLLERLIEADGLTAEQAGVVSRQLELGERFTDQARFLQRLARDEDATLRHRLMWARQAYFTGKHHDFTEVRDLVAAEERPVWLEAYAALVARQRGDDEAADMILSDLGTDDDPVVAAWRALLDNRASPLDRLQAIRADWSTPTDPVLLRRVGQDLAAVGHHEAAVAALLRATKVAPAWADAHIDLAGVLLELGRPGSAIEIIDAASRRGVGAATLDALRIRTADQRIDQLDADQLADHLERLGPSSASDFVPQRLRAWWSAGRGDDANELADVWLEQNWNASGEADQLACIDVLDRFAPDRLDDLASSPTGPSTSPTVAARLAEALNNHGRSERAWRYFDAAHASHNNSDVTIDWAVARVALGAATGEPAAPLWAEALIEREGLGAVLARVDRWPLLLRRAWPLREALRSHPGLDRATSTALGLHVDSLIDRVLGATDMAVARNAGGELARTLTAYDRQGPDAALRVLDRLLLADGRYGEALNLRVQRQRQHPERAAPLADAIILLRLLGQQNTADQLTIALEQRADEAIRNRAGITADLVAAVARVGDRQRAADLLTNAAAGDDSPDRLALRFVWATETGNTSETRELADRLWASGRQRDRWLVVDRLSGTSAERIAALRERLQGLELDETDRRLLEIALLERTDRAAALTELSQPSLGGEAHSRLWQWRLAAKLAEDPTAPPTELLDSASRSARSAVWFEALSRPDMVATFSSALQSELTRGAALELINADRSIGDALVALTRIAETDSVDPALIDAVADAHVFPSVGLAFVQSSAVPPEQVLDRLGLLLIGHRVAPTLGRQIIAACAQAGALTRANHYGTLLAATHDAEDEATLLTVASVRAAAGATGPAATLAAEITERRHPGLDQPAFAGELASIFISGARFRDARELLLPRLGDDPAWANAALRLVPRLADQPDEMVVWIEALARYVGPEDTGVWLQLVQNATACHGQTGSTRPVQLVRRFLDPVANDAAPGPLVAAAGLLAQVDGDYATMQRHYERMLEEKPDDIATLNNYADGLVSMGARLDDALRMAEQARAQLPDNAQIHDTLARVHEALGNDSEAERFARRAMELEPGNGQWPINLFALLLRQDDTEAARAMLGPIESRLDPEAPEPLAVTPPMRREFQSLAEDLRRREREVRGGAS